jgi:PAS domain S-box-containing protein
LAKTITGRFTGYWLGTRISQRWAPGQNNLKFAVMVPFVLFVAALAAGISLAGYVANEREGTRVSAQVANAARSGFDAAVATEATSLRAILDTLSQDSALKDALRRRDRDALMALERGLFTKLRRDNAVTHFYFIDPQRICLLRVHQPDRFGDRIDRITMRDAERTEATAQGVELGPLGTLTLRVVMPWRDDDGALLGFVELGKEVDDLLISVRKQFGAIPLLFLPKDRIERDGWETGMKMLGRSAQWDEFPDTVLSVRDSLPNDLIHSVHDESADHMVLGGRWYAWQLLPLMDAAGKNAGKLGMVMDVTHRHHDFHQLSLAIGIFATLGAFLVVAIFWFVLSDVERELLLSRDALGEQEKRYHCLFESCSAVALLVDSSAGIVVEANAAATEYYGWDRSRLPGLPVSEIAARQGAFDAADGTSVSGAVVSRHRLATGAIRDVEVFVTPLSLGGKDLSYCIVHDITDRRRAEIERHSAEARLVATGARLKLVLETTAEGIFGVDDEGRVMFANAAAAGLLGWSSVDEMHGKPFPDVTGHLCAEGTACEAEHSLIFTTLRDGKTRRVQDEFFAGRTDQALPIEYVVSPLVVSDIVVGAIVAFHGISERKALEEDLRRSNGELEQFAYVASHDLRQPLRMISNYMALLKRRLGKDLDDDSRDFLNFAVDGAKRMDALIIGLLDYARVGREVSTDAVPLAESVADALHNLSFAITDSGTEVSVAEGLPVIAGNAMELMRLFQNLVSNAVKYGAPNRPPRIEIGWRDSGRRWLLWVRDNGAGIAADDLERVFQIFQRLTSHEQVEGTGIGLAVSRKIVEKHQGRIWVESQPGVGSTFYVSLPKARV